MRENKLVKELRSDPTTYVEGVGKVDRQTVVEALREDGDSTVLRLVIGASSGEVPLRAVSYIASAYAVRDRYLPKAQLQIVYPVNAAFRANRANTEKSTRQALRLRAGTSIVLSSHDEDESRQNITHLVDEPVQRADALEDMAASVITNDKSLSEKLGRSAMRRDGNVASYVASHLRVHDRLYGFEPLDRYCCAQPAAADRVISIGAQSERIFYAARMACRQTGFRPDVETGQIFTRHVLPPYQSCLEGEPAIIEIANQPWDVFMPADVPVNHNVRSVSKDLAYLKSELVRQDSLPIGFGFDARRHLLTKGVI